MAVSAKFIRTKTSLAKWGDIIIDRLKRQLRIDRFKASGDTGRSLRKEVTGIRYLKLSIFSKGQWKNDESIISALNLGINPKRPPPASVIARWMKDRHIRPRSSNGRFLSPSDTNIERASYAIARGIAKMGTIKRFGYKGSGLSELAITPIEVIMKAELRNELGLDLQQEMNKGISKENLK